MYYCNPLNIPYKYQLIQQGGNLHVNREAADPSLVEFKGAYYLFVSMAASYFASDDLVTWTQHPLDERLPAYDYAPDVRVVGEYLYFCASKRDENCSIFRSRDPINEGFEAVAESFPFWDPNVFLDDDGRLYLYWGCSNVTPVYGIELDRETLQPIGDKVAVISARTEDIGFERTGEDHIAPRTEEQIHQLVEQYKAQMPDMDPAQADMIYAYLGNNPYIEGAWMTKHQGMYYLQYAAPGTQYNTYADGVYIGQSPLGPFELAKNNPFSYKPGGFITGAGHGSTLEDKQGRWWHASTMRISMNHQFERRIGLWKAGFDQDGELFCDQRYGDWPVNEEKAPWAAPDWMLLSYGKAVSASSGTGAQCAVDEDIRTWWTAATPTSGEWISIDLGMPMSVHAVQVNFADHELDLPFPADDKVQVGQFEKRYIDPVVQRTRWLLEGSVDGETYFVIEDKSMAETDLSHDLVIREDGISCQYLKLTVLELPYGQMARVSGLRAFGTADGQKPDPCEDVEVKLFGDLDAVVTWKPLNAAGCNILWGHAPDKLYHSCIVHGKSEQAIGALVKGQSLYVRVDAFNESGITEGSVLHVR